MQTDIKDLLYGLGIVLTFAVGVWNLVANYRMSRKTSFINTVTNQRVKWIEQLRQDISAFSGLTHTWCFSSLSGRPEEHELLKEIDRLRQVIRLRLNPNGTYDRKIQDLIVTIPQLTDISSRPELQAALDDLTETTQLLLKEEWEKVKWESEHGNLNMQDGMPGFKIDRGRRRLRRLLLVGLAVGAGVSIGLTWYSVRRPERPWDRAAVVARLDDIATEGDKNTLVFGYVLENKTVRDYELTPSHRSTLVGKLARQSSMTSEASDYLSIDLPIFLPPGQRQRVRVHLRYPVPYRVSQDALDKEREAFERDVRQHLRTVFRNLDGFTLFDHAHRYQIEMPKGW
jgi:hypothetical protein